MALAITWESFLKCADEIIQTSTKIGDGWIFEGDRNETGGGYLKKHITKEIKKEHKLCEENLSVIEDPQEFVPSTSMKLLLRWEYHIYYNISYGVPALCFNVWNNKGSLLTLKEVWKHCNLTNTYQNPEDLYAVLTQQDHPVLQRPFFTVHPCKTHEILNISDTQNNNLLIRYITSVGPIFNLELDITYGLKIIH